MCARSPLLWHSARSQSLHGAAGLTLSYWVDKFIALRKCQKPYALAEEVTYSINILVRLLPFVQNILMYKLYFQVSAAGHALHTWCGLK